MSRHSFRYDERAIDPSDAFPGGRTALRPMLRVALVNGPRRLECYAIVDSGADHCVFPRSFMQPLGVDPQTAPTEGLAGVGNQGVLTHFSEITVELQGIVQLSIFAGFTVGLEHWGVGLLGQRGFFDRLQVHFDLPNGRFETEAPMQR